MILCATAGYMAIEGWGFMDALYMTMITITTVGYSEVNDLSAFGRIYNILVLVTGFGFFVYVAGAVVQFMLEGQVRDLMGKRRLDRRLRKMRDHYIICGFGRIGRVLCRQLKTRPINMVVIEKTEEPVEILEEENLSYIIGDATDETALMEAGIDRAAGLVAALATDADNVFLVLTARQLNPDLKIIARAGEEGADAKLLAAGADRVESPYVRGAVTMAQRILRPTVTSFLDLALTGGREDIQMEEIPVAEASPLSGRMLKDSGIRQKYNLIIIAMKRSDGGMRFNPSFESRIEPGETVIAVGKSADLNALARVLNPN